MSSSSKETKPGSANSGKSGKSGEIAFTLDGRKVTAGPQETIWQAAKRHGTDIPHLCYRDSSDYRADGNCRACMVEIEGERVLAASCIRKPAEGMVVNSESKRAATARRMVMELLVADQPGRNSAHDPESTLWHYAETQGVEQARFPSKPAPSPDDSHPAIAVNMDACIQCNLCVRACREVQVNDVIGLAGRGADAHIVFDFGDDMGASTCVGCGECVQACPTGALMPKTLLDDAQKREDRRCIGTRGASQQVAALRQGTLWVRLYRQPRTSDQTVDQARRRAKIQFPSL